MISHYNKEDKDNAHDPFKSLLSDLLSNPIAEAAPRYSDKHIDKAMNEIDDGVKDLLLKYPSMKRPNMNSGF